MPRTPRRRIAPGIYRDKYSLTGVVSLGGRPKERAFPLDTDLKEIARWQLRMRTEYSEADLSPVRGTLADDVERYLTRMKKRPASLPAKRSELKAWCAELGKKSRQAVTPEDCDRVIGAWLDADVSKKTVVNRCRTLAHLYRTLANDKRARTPLDNVDVPKPAKRRPTPVDPALIIRVEKALRTGNAKDHARYMVRMATGVRPSVLMRVRPDQVNLKARTVEMDGGKGGLPVVHVLNDDMLAAWTAFVKADAFGPFDTSDHAKAVQAAGWPKGVRLYNARHTLGIMLSEEGADLSDIQAWMGHADLKTTREFYVPRLESRMRTLATKVKGRFGWRAPRAAKKAAKKR